MSPARIDAIERELQDLDDYEAKFSTRARQSRRRSLQNELMAGLLAEEQFRVKAAQDYNAAEAECEAAMAAALDALAIAVESMESARAARAKVDAAFRIAANKGVELGRRPPTSSEVAARDPKLRDLFRRAQSALSVSNW